MLNGRQVGKRDREGQTDKEDKLEGSKIMSYMTARRLSIILILAELFCVLILYAIAEINALFIIVLVISGALIICAVVITVKFYRCPHCHELFPVRSQPGNNCPNCGEKL